MGQTALSSVGPPPLGTPRRPGFLRKEVSHLLKGPPAAFCGVDPSVVKIGPSPSPFLPSPSPPLSFPPAMTQFLSPQTPLQDSLIELSDSSLNKMATDMFLGVGMGQRPGPRARRDAAL